MVTAVPLAMSSWTVASAADAPVGQGFNLNASDLRFILKQIKIAEQHADTLTAANPCGTMRGTGPDQIPAGEVGDTLPWGLRLIDGTCNNLVAGKVTVGAADQDFPRLVTQGAQGGGGRRPGRPGPRARVASSSYTQTSGTVIDSQPRVISNLIVDQTDTNPAAVEAAGEEPEVTPSGAFFIPNVAPDVGLSAPYNSWFTLFGQFFDHGLDLVNKGGNGTVFMPLEDGRPAVRTPGSPTNFMVLTRATARRRPRGEQPDLTVGRPEPDLHLAPVAPGLPARVRARTPAGDPQTTGRPHHRARRRHGHLGRRQGAGRDDARHRADRRGRPEHPAAGHRPLRPLRARAQRPAADGRRRAALGADGIDGTPDDDLVEGNLTTPVPTTGATKTGHAFLDDIAHNAVPKSGSAPDGDAVVTPSLVVCEQPDFPAGCVNQYDDEMLDAHFIAGDGRVNENIGLTTVHHVFHSEHNRLVEDIRQKIEGTDADRTGALLTAAEEADWKATTATPPVTAATTTASACSRPPASSPRWSTSTSRSRSSSARSSRWSTSSARAAPATTPAINPAIKAEFAHAVYRFGHSMLTESVDRVRADGTARQHRPARRVPQPAVVHGRTAARRTRRPATSSVA